MYRTRKSTTSNKKNILLGLGVLLILGSILLILEKTGRINLVGKGKQAENANQSETINYAPTSEEEQKQIDDTKTNIDDTQSNPNSTDPTPLTPQVTITKAAQSGSELVIQTELNGNNWVNCYLVLSQGANKIERTAEVIFQAEFSTCAGFSIPVNDFPAGGNWIASLKAISSSGTSENSENVTVIIVK